MKNTDPKNSLSNKRPFIVLGLLAIAAIALVYFFTRDSSPAPSVIIKDVPSPTQTTSSIAQNSPISPVSVVSPTAPITAGLPVVSSTIPITAGLPDVPEQIDYFSRAEEAFLAGDYLAALSIFNRMLDLDPENPIALTYRGNTYTELGDYEKAIIDYTRAIEIVPETYPQPHYNRGRIYLLLGEYDKALADLERSIELDNFDDINFAYRANGNIGIVYHQLGEYEKALAAFEASIAADDSKADVYVLRGDTYTAMEDYEAAIADYETALIRFPGYYLAHQGLGYIYYKTSRLDEALESLNQTATMAPNNPQVHLYLVLVYLAMDDLDQAENELSQAITLIANLPPTEQDVIYRGILSDLETFSAENPDKNDAVKFLMDQIPDQ